MRLIPRQAVTYLAVGGGGGGGGTEKVRRDRLKLSEGTGLKDQEGLTKKGQEGLTEKVRRDGLKRSEDRLKMSGGTD